MTATHAAGELPRLIPAAMRKPILALLKLALFVLLVGAPLISSAEAQYRRGGGEQSVCVTSRGNCSAGYASEGAGCKCMIDGFGMKRGNVQAGYSRGEPEYRERRPRFRDDGYGERRRRGGDDDFGERRRRRDFGTVCVTSRGECSVGRPVPLESGCKCMIPDFGMKRGHVKY